MPVVLALLLWMPLANAHGLSPMRLEAPSGTTHVAYRFTAYNTGKVAEDYDVECFRETTESRIPCNSIPKNFWVPANGKRLVKIQIPTEGKDGVYLACTIQAQPQGLIQTRICARIGVGVSASPDSHRERNASAGSAVSARARSNKGG